MTYVAVGSCVSEQGWDVRHAQGDRDAHSTSNVFTIL
jgi:hypothetical protein